MPSPTTMRIVTSSNQKYGLDFISGAVDSCVAFFSLYRSTKYFKGQCVEVMRGSDYATAWFGYKGSLGYIDYIAIALFCAGTTGKVREWVNGSVLAGVQNAIQPNYAKMPIIYESGAFNVDGLRFVSANSVKLAITDYAAVKIATSPYSIYQNFYTPSAHVGFIFVRNGRYDTRIDNLSYISRVKTTILSSFAPSYPSTIKSVNNWQGTEANQVKSNVNGTIITSTCSEVVETDSVDFTVGARAVSYYFTGNIKSIIIWNSNQYDNYTQLASKF